MARGRPRKIVRVEWPLSLPILTAAEVADIKATIAERNRLMLQYQPMVYKVAVRLWQTCKMVHRAGSIEGLVSSGNLALLNAIRLYDPHHPSKAKFITYAMNSVRNNMLREAGRERLIHLPEKVRLAMMGYKGRTEYLVDAERSSRMHHLHGAFDAIAAKDEGHGNSWQVDLDLVLNYLRPSERKLIEERWGLLNAEPQNLRMLGVRYGVSKERIRQRLCRIYKQLKKVLADEYT